HAAADQNCQRSSRSAPCVAFQLGLCQLQLRAYQLASVLERVRNEGGQLVRLPAWRIRALGHGEPRCIERATRLMRPCDGAFVLALSLLASRTTSATLDCTTQDTGDFNEHDETGVCNRVDRGCAPP